MLSADTNTVTSKPRNASPSTCPPKPGRSKRANVGRRANLFELQRSSTPSKIDQAIAKTEGCEEMILMALQAIGCVIDQLRDADAVLHGRKPPRHEESMGAILYQVVVSSRGAK